ncbi:MAG TPA: T9SS type A sorting domain-containing protein [Ignavibacteria bacterium]|nr:T9SS type A sorting domain-containing protein [Ignavibacteria bacterium]HQY53464.1 T9SS type A sorting domain-containing protein [Ignavibacteria bacterium]HRB01599.1 T9SS type A sorting domain-containing protein [Ignavibacteria bacterium]
MWKRIYKGDGNLNFCFALTTDDSGNVYAAGRSTNTGTGEDYVTIKYYSDGDTAWIRNYDGGYDNFDEARSVVVDNYQNVYVTGLTSSSTGRPSYTTIKYNKFGDISWIKNFSGSYLTDVATSLKIDINYNVIVTGYSQTSINFASIATIKYSQITGFVDKTNLFNLDFKLYQNYPNPFNPSTTIKFTLISESNVILKIYNALGKEIETVINIKKPKGTHVVIFNGKNFTTGIYFYSLFINGNLIDTKKMILIK